MAVIGGASAARGCARRQIGVGKSNLKEKLSEEGARESGGTK